MCLFETRVENLLAAPLTKHFYLFLVVWQYASAKFESKNMHMKTRFLCSFDICIHVTYFRYEQSFQELLQFEKMDENDRDVLTKYAHMHVGLCLKHLDKINT